MLIPLLSVAALLCAIVLSMWSRLNVGLLALVWGPRFDRQHAHALLDHQPAPQPGLIRMVMDAADRFDRLGCAQQQRVRQLILRHRAQAARW